MSICSPSKKSSVAFDYRRNSEEKFTKMYLSFFQLLEQRFSSNLRCLFSFTLMIPPFLILLFVLKWIFATSPSSTTKSLPPSPPKLPIIGNFHQLGTLPRRALLSLAQRYGPIMLLHLGQVPVVIISSPDAAREIMKTQDIFFSNKPELRSFKLLLYDMKDVLASPYGDHWKQLKSIFVHHLVSRKRVQSFRSVREEETALLIRKISNSCSSLSLLVDLRDLFVTLSNDVVCRVAFGRKYTGDENGEKLERLLGEHSMLTGAITFQDYIPMLGWLDRLRGTDARMRRVAQGLDEFLEGLIEERMTLLENERARGVNLDEDGEDFVDTLLRIQKDDDGTGIPLSRHSIKAVLLDVYAGATETTSAFLEWAMTELIGNPNAMKKLQNEVKELLNGKLDIVEDDLKKMEFLKAVIKETLRIHPPVALHLRTTKKDTKLNGYTIDAGTMVIINSWGISNDPKLWDEPDQFRPERFLDSSVDFKGHDFEFTPFGAGRRQCPGSYFATAIIEYVLANLVYRFDWNFPREDEGEDMDMTECPSSVVHRKKVRLQAKATPSSY